MLYAVLYWKNPTFPCFNNLCYVVHVYTATDTVFYVTCILIRTLYNCTNKCVNKIRKLLENCFKIPFMRIFPFTFCLCQCNCSVQLTWMVALYVFVRFCRYRTCKYTISYVILFINLHKIHVVLYQCNWNVCKRINFLIEIYPEMQYNLLYTLHHNRIEIMFHYDSAIIPNRIGHIGTGWSKKYADRR